MAERRMFAKTIIDSDAFLDMPLSTQCLYFHLSMRADDDGFLNNCKKIQRTIGASDDDMRLLMMKKFIIPFESGIVVIKHWKIHNYIQSDRYKPTVYQEEKSQLVMQKNRSYSLCINPAQESEKARLPESVTDTGCIHDGYSLEAQDRLGKDRLGKDNKIFVEDSKEMILSRLLFSLIKRNNDKAKQPNLQTWCKYIDYMLRIDKREYDDVKAVIEWCQDDDFWQTNILSTQKLRKQYEQLYIKMLKDKGSANNARNIKKDNRTSEKPKYDFSCF